MQNNYQSDQNQNWRREKRRSIRLNLTNEVSERLKSGHPWVYQKGIIGYEKRELSAGQQVDLYDPSGKFVARGLYDPESPIAVRTFTRSYQENMDLSFCLASLKRSYALRQRCLDLEKNTAFRLVNGENDHLPGLVIDIYGDFAVLLLYTSALRPFRKIFCQALKELFPNLRGVVEKSVVLRSAQPPTAVRGGVSTGTLALQDEPGGKVVWGEKPDEELVVLENGIKFYVNVKQGQKTGLYLDHRDNRLIMQKYCSQQKVLNCFSYTGAFSLYAALGGAKQTVSLDLSRQANDWAAKNFSLNGLNSKEHKFITGDVFEYLRILFKQNQQYDLIILDPPPYATSKKNVFHFMAIKQYF